MPRSLHGALAELAEREGTSLNQFITGTLASAIGWNGEEKRPTPAVAAEVDPPSGVASARTLSWLLIVNAAAVSLAALAAIALLLYAWLG